MVAQLRVLIAPALAALAMTSAGSALAQEKTTTERLKEKAGSAVTSVKKGVGSAGDAIKNKYNQAKDKVTAMETESRVHARLHWDKALNGAKIELTAPKVGTIVLTGVVSDARARAKAIELTTDTVGVNEVVDHLTTQSNTVVEPAAVK